MRMSKTAAMKVAAQAVSQPIGSKTSWQVIGPWRMADVDGPTTSRNYISYAAAREAMTKWRAELTLHLMGLHDDEVGYLVDNSYGSLAYRVDHVIRRINAAD